MQRQTAAVIGGGALMVDGGINGARLKENLPDRVAELGEEGMLDIDAIAEMYWQLHAQPKSAWTQELDLRPYKEPF